MDSSVKVTTYRPARASIALFLTTSFFLSSSLTIHLHRPSVHDPHISPCASSSPPHIFLHTTKFFFIPLSGITVPTPPCFSISISTTPSLAPFFSPLFFFNPVNLFFILSSRLFITLLSLSLSLSPFRLSLGISILVGRPTHEYANASSRSKPIIFQCAALAPSDVNFTLSIRIQNTHRRTAFSRAQTRAARIGVRIIS